MSEQLDINEQPEAVFDSGDIPINDDAIITSINFEDSSKMRIELAMSRIQQYSAMAVVDPAFKAKYDAWVGYYNSIKDLSATSSYEELYGIQLPE